MVRDATLHFCCIGQTYDTTNQQERVRRIFNWNADHIYLPTCKIQTNCLVWMSVFSIQLLYSVFADVL